MWENRDKKNSEHGHFLRRVDLEEALMKHSGSLNMKSTKVDMKDKSKF